MFLRLDRDEILTDFWDYGQFYAFDLIYWNLILSQFNTLFLFCCYQFVGWAVHQFRDNIRTRSILRFFGQPMSPPKAVGSYLNIYLEHVIFIYWDFFCVEKLVKEICGQRFFWSYNNLRSLTQYEAQDRSHPQWIFSVLKGTFFP